jgi:hypothetical protein
MCVVVFINPQSTKRLQKNQVRALTLGFLGNNVIKPRKALLTVSESVKYSRTSGSNITAPSSSLKCCTCVVRLIYESLPYDRPVCFVMFAAHSAAKIIFRQHFVASLFCDLEVFSFFIYFAFRFSALRQLMSRIFCSR